MAGTILIVDDEHELAKYLARILAREGYQVATAENGAVARKSMAALHPDVVLMDLRLPDADGGDLMVEFQQVYKEAQFIIITAHGSIRSAVKSTQRGAIDYLTKPFEPEEMLLSVENALRGRNLREEVKRLRHEQKGGLRRTTECFGKSKSPAFSQMLRLARQAADQDGIVLLLGESGAGKDHLARWIHQHSRRSDGPFFSLNCAALSRELAESELFGHEPGAFTGTRGRKRGLLELAENGTLLLNEFGELELGLQSKLLTFLDTRSFLRVGGERPISVNARIIAATNRDLRKDVEHGSFRKDLYYRINVFPIRAVPLRERRGDLPDLAQGLLERLSNDVGLSQTPTIDEKAMELLEAYTWPGNIRELRNVLERAVILSSGAIIKREHLHLDETDHQRTIEVSLESGDTLHDITRHVARNLIGEALRRTETRRDAAMLLGISRHALAHQMRVLGINVRDADKARS